MHSRFKFVGFALLASLYLTASLDLSAQVTTADLVGTVKDGSGAVVAGAQVTATNEATGVSRAVQTDTEGHYLITQLQPGRYTLTAEIPGFRKHVQKGIELQVNQRAQID